MARSFLAWDFVCLWKEINRDFFSCILIIILKQSHTLSPPSSLSFAFPILCLLAFICFFWQALHLIMLHFLKKLSLVCCHASSHDGGERRNGRRQDGKKDLAGRKVIEWHGRGE